MTLKDNKKNKISIFNKCVYLTFIVLLSLLFVFLLVSCKPSIKKPSFNIKDVNFVSGIDDGMVQKGVDGGTLYLAKEQDENGGKSKPETLYMHISLDNPQIASIDYVTVNDTKYFNKDGEDDKINTFTTNSYYSEVVVELFSLPSDIKKITLNSIGYRLPNERTEYKAKLSMNVKYDAEFTVICDLTEISMTEEEINEKNINIIKDSDGNIIKKTKELAINYLSQFPLPYNNLQLTLSERHRSGKCPLGKGFIGWYTVEEKPQLINPEDDINYTFTKNIEIKPRFVDRYEYQECEYMGEEGYEVKKVNIVPVLYKNTPILKNELDKEYIPDFYQGKKILGIASSAFTTHKAGSFDVHLGNNVKYIGDNAFEGVKNLKIDFNNVEEIKDAAFKNCGEIEFLNEEFPSTLQKIGNEAFYGATPKEYLVKNISGNTSDARLSKSIFIPNTIISIGESAFENSKIERLYFESGLILNKFGNRAFANCRELKTFVMNTLRPSSSSYLTIDKENLTEITAIPSEAFLNSKSLISKKGIEFKNNGINGFLNLAEGVEEIESKAFNIDNFSSSQTSFEHIEFPYSLKCLRDNAFYNVPLSSIVFKPSSNPVSVGNKVFSNSRAEEVVFYKINKFGDDVFLNNPNIEAIFIKDKDILPFKFGKQKSSLKDFGFMNPYYKFFVPEDKVQGFKNKNSDDDIQKRILSNKYVYEMTIGNSKCKISYDDINPGVNEDIRITNIWGNIPSEFTIPDVINYNNGTNIEKVVKELGEYCFIKSVKTVNIPLAVTKIGDFAFQGNKKLCVVNIFKENAETQLEELGRNAFNGTSITSFTSGSKLKFIGANCFLRCGNLKTVKLIKGENIEIGVSAFYLCGIEKLYIGNDDVIDTLGASAFSQCSNLKEAYIEFTDPEKISGYVFNFPAAYIFNEAHPDLEICFSSSMIASKMITKYEYFKKNKIYWTTWNAAGMPDEQNKHPVQ